MLRLVITAFLAMGATALALAPSFGLAAERVGTGVLSRGSTSVSLHITPSPVPTPSEGPAEAAEGGEEEAEPSATPTAAPSATPTAEPTPTPAEAATPKPSPTPKPTTAETPKPKSVPTAKAAPLVDALHAELWDALLRTCLGSASSSEECFRLLAERGISLSDFKARVFSRLEALHKQRSAMAAEFETYLKKCIASGTVESEACQVAWRLSGLSLADFRAKIAAKLATPKPATPKPVSGFELSLRRCIESRELYGPECYEAWQLSGLSSEDFDKKILREWEGR